MATPGFFQHLHDAFVNSAENSPLGGEGLARFVLKNFYGHTDDQINRAIDSENQDYQKKYANAHGISHGAASLLGTVLGGVNPTYAVGGMGTGVVRRVATQAVTQAAANAVSQKVQMNTGQRKSFDPSEVVNSANEGALFQGGVEGATPIVGKVAKFAKGKIAELLDHNGQPVEPVQPPTELNADGSPATENSVGPDGLPGNGSVRPIDPKVMAKIMNDPEAAGATGINDNQPNRRWNNRDIPTTLSHDNLIDTLPPANQEYLRSQEIPAEDNGHPDNLESLTPEQMRERSRQEVAGKVTYLPDHIDAANEADLPPRVNLTPYQQGAIDRFDSVLADHAKANGMDQDTAFNYIDTLPDDHPFFKEFQDRLDNTPVVPRDPNAERVDGTVTPAEAQEMDASAPKPAVDNTSEGQFTQSPQSTVPANDLEASPQQIPTEYQPEVPEPSAKAGTFEELPTSDTAGNKYLNYHASTGDVLPIKMGIDPDGTAEIAVDQFGNGTNKLGPTEIRQAMYSLMDQYPEIKRFGGFRRSGAGAGRVQEITPQPRAAPMAADTQDPAGLGAAAAETDQPQPRKLGDILGNEEGSFNPFGRDKSPDIEDIPDEELTPEQRLQLAIRQALPMRVEHNLAVSKERSNRFSEAAKAQQQVGGEAGYHAALSKLEGPLPTAPGLAPIHNQMSQAEINDLYNQVTNHPSLDLGETFNARRGLAKLLDPQGIHVPTDNELELLGRVFPDVVDELGKSSSSFDKATNILGIPRAMKTIGDLGVAFRQASPLIGTKEYWQAFPAMFKGVASEKLWQAGMDEIASRPTYPLMKEGGLALTNLGHDLSQREEFAASKIAEKIPGVRQSERGFTGYLNQVRADTFDRLYNQAKEQGMNVNHPQYLKQLGDFVNTMTGRSSLGVTGDKAAPFLAASFFSPRLQASRLKLLTNPFNLNFYRLPAQIQKEYLKGVVSYGIYQMSLLGMASYLGAKVSTDPTNTDYGRIIMKDTHFDTSGSFQPYIRMVAQIATGHKVSPSGNTTQLGSGYGKPSRLDVVNSFIESKASPNVDFILNELRGKDFAHPKTAGGDELDYKSKDPLTNPLGDFLIPMGLEASMKAGADYGLKDPLTYASGVAETYGIGANTYKPHEKKVKADEGPFGSSSGSDSETGPFGKDGDRGGPF